MVTPALAFMLVSYTDVAVTVAVPVDPGAVYTPFPSTEPLPALTDQVTAVHKGSPEPGVAELHAGVIALGGIPLTDT